MMKNRYIFLLIAFCTQALHLHGMDVDQASIDLLQAVRDNNIEDVQAAMAAGADLNIQDHDGHTALMIAKGKDLPDGLRNTALIWAEHRDFPHIENFLTALIHAGRLNELNTKVLEDLYNLFNAINRRTEQQNNILEKLENINPQLK